MIDKQQVLDSVTNQVLATMDQEIRNAIGQKVADIVNNHIDAVDMTVRVDNSIGAYLKYLIEDNNKHQILNRFAEKTDVVVGMLLAELPTTIKAQVIESVKSLVNELDISNAVQQAIADTVARTVTVWPDRSIPATAINFDHAAISASVLNGGQANGFSSKGMSDFASANVLSTFDNLVVVDTNLTVNGNLLVTGALETDSEFYRTLAKNVADSITTNIADVVDAARADLQQNIAATQVIVKDEALVVNGVLNRFVTDSNLQKVGRLRSLDVGGEVTLTDSVTVTRGRLGINTTEPQAALDIWDQEVEIVAEKSESSTGYIGLARPGTLRIGVNRRAAITVTPTAEVEIPGLRVGRIEKISLAVSSEIPTGPGAAGDIIFNNQPLSNGVFAWICLEGTRWAPVRLDM